MKEPTKCEYATYVGDIPICKLNLIPCDCVRDDNCPMTEEYNELMVELSKLIKGPENESSGYDF